MSSQPSRFLGLSDKMQHLLDKSLDTLDQVLDGEELSFDRKVAIAARVLQFSSNTATGLTAADGMITSTTALQTTTIPASANGDSSSAPSTSSLVFLPANYVQLDDFLSSEDCAALDALLHEKKDSFQATSVVRENKIQHTDTRQSIVLYESNFQTLADRIKQQVLDALPMACEKLQHPLFQPQAIVAQLTAHKDGCFYKRHSDAATPQTATREMTYVYYFHREPPAFSGGELRIYDTELNNDQPRSRGTYQTVTPRNNSIIFFNSRCLHEVMPVNCPSQEFFDSRFTINGWIRH